MNKEDISHASLQGSWTHSFEEDQGDVRVYRPTHAFMFPPARGRESLEFRDGGELAEMTPGPDDRPHESTGKWTALGMNRFRLDSRSENTSRVIEIVEQTPSILKIRKI